MNATKSPLSSVFQYYFIISWTGELFSIVYQNLLSVQMPPSVPDFYLESITQGFVQSNTTGVSRCPKKFFTQSGILNHHMKVVRDDFIIERIISGHTGFRAWHWRVNLFVAIPARIAFIARLLSQNQSLIPIHQRLRHSTLHISYPYVPLSAAIG